MYETKLKPNFKKLRDYFPDIKLTEIERIDESDGVLVYLDYMSEEG